jgi:hypothetical protein
MIGQNHRRVQHHTGDSVRRRLYFTRVFSTLRQTPRQCNGRTRTQPGGGDTIGVAATPAKSVLVFLTYFVAAILASMIAIWCYYAIVN